MTHTAPHHPQGARRHTTAWAAAAALAGLSLLGALGPAHAAGVSGQGTWETTLQGRDLDGNTANGYEAYYDTVLNITWLANANLAASNTFGLAYNTNLGDHPNDAYGPFYTESIRTNGRMTWGAALHWIDAMNQANYLGYNDWRLPDVKPVNGSSFQYGYSVAGTTDRSYNITSPQSEMAHLYHVTLGNKSYSDTAGNVQSGWGLSNTGPFSNVQSGNYWSGVEYAPYTNFAWSFNTFNGRQGDGLKNNALYAWAVRPGDVAAPVPEPQTIALALAGLAVAGVAARRRRG